MEGNLGKVRVVILHPPPLQGVSGNVWRCFCLSPLGCGGAISILWAGAREAAKHATMYRAVSTTMTNLGQNVSSAYKPCFVLIASFDVGSCGFSTLPGRDFNENVEGEGA